MNSRWSLIAGRLPGRTDNEIKNYWNTHIKRKLISRGIDPQTHSPLNSTSTSTTTAGKVFPQKLEFKPTINPDLIIPKFGLMSKTIDFKRSCPDANNTFKHIRTDSGGTGNSGTTDDGQQTGRVTHPHKAHEIDLELSIGLSPFRAVSVSSAESKEARSPPEKMAAPASQTASGFFRYIRPLGS
uniref:Uncharacterized protein n=1 Tax=Opuntia streptacantha TaxID=393608 RepID=A0A7C8ZDV8_OPUST